MREMIKKDAYGAFEKNDYTSKILQIMRSTKSPKIISEMLSGYHANDIANAFEQLSKSEREKIYRLVSNEEMAEILEYTDDFPLYISELSPLKAAGILRYMEDEYLLEALSETDEEKRKLIISLMDEDSKRSVLLLSSYSEDEIGSKLSTNYIRIQSSYTVKQAMSSLISQAPDNDNIYTIYVLDDMGVFYGAIDLKDLIMARENTDLEDLIVTSYPYVYAFEKTDECLDTLREYYEDSIPVLSEDNHILGVITAKSIIDAYDEEIKRDYAQLGGLTDAEDLNEPVTQSMKKRLPWLIALLCLGLVVSGVVGAFEGVIARLPIAICFQSLILDMAGNVGTQSLAVTIRVLTDGQVSVKDKLKLMMKEAKTSRANGILLGILAFIGIGLYIFTVKGKTLPFAFAVSGCLGVSLVLAIIVSGITGTVIPMFFKKIGVDPAVASGPLITTVNDLAAVVTYYGLVWILLINTLHMAG